MFAMIFVMGCDGCSCCSGGNHKGCPYVRIANRRVAGAGLKPSPAGIPRTLASLVRAPFDSRKGQRFLAALRMRWLAE